jgi:DNA replication protein DnaC
MSELKPLFPSPIIKKEKCKHCGNEYNQKYIEFNGELKPINYPYCQDCLKKWEQYKLTHQPKETATKDYHSEVREEWRKLKIPPMYLTKTFKEFKTSEGNLKKVYDACVEYADGFPFAYKKYIAEKKHAYPSLMLSAITGTGKTHLACAIGHRVLDRWHGEAIPCPIYFVSEGEIYRRIIATYSYSNDEKINKPSEDDIVNNLIQVPILILDDLGKEVRNDLKFVQRILFNVIDGRYRIMRPMIITTNMSNNELLTYLGDSSQSACLSRLMEMCKDHQWQIVARDYRLK